MKKFLIPIAALFLGGAVLAQQNMSIDEALIRTGLEGDAYEILASELAVERSESEDIQQFAQEMIDAHTATSDRLRELADSYGYEAEFLASPAGGVKLAHLGQLEGAEFDQEYLTQQLVAHQSALTIYRIGASAAEDEELQRFASDTAGEIGSHLARIHELMETHGVTDPFSAEAIATFATEPEETEAPAESEQPAEEQPEEEQPQEEQPEEEQPQDDSAEEAPVDEEPTEEAPVEDDQPEEEQQDETNEG